MKIFTMDFFDSKIAPAVSCKSHSSLKKNRIMKLYFVNDMIGQLFALATLNMWKLSKKCLSPFWKNAHEVERPSLLCLFIYTNFYGVLTSKYLCKVINQTAKFVNSDLPAFFSVQTTSLWKVLYHRRAKSLSRKLKRGSKSPLCEILEVPPRFYYRKEGSSRYYFSMI